MCAPAVTGSAMRRNGHTIPKQAISAQWPASQIFARPANSHAALFSALILEVLPRDLGHRVAHSAFCPTYPNLVNYVHLSDGPNAPGTISRGHDTLRFARPQGHSPASLDSRSRSINGHGITYFAILRAVINASFLVHYRAS